MDNWKKSKLPLMKFTKFYIEKEKHNIYIG